MSPSEAKVQAAKEKAEENRRRKIIEKDVRNWYAADFRIVYEAVSRTKLNQNKPDKKVSPVLFESILKAHKAKLAELEEQIQNEIEEQLNEVT